MKSALARSKLPVGSDWQVLPVRCPFVNSFSTLRAGTVPRIHMYGAGGMAFAKGVAITTAQGAQQ
jgi:hypothetical protein